MQRTSTSPPSNSVAMRYADGSVRSPRFIQWILFFICAMISMGAAIDAADTAEFRTPAQRYAIACSSLTFIITLIAVLLHLCAPCAVLIVGTKLEGLTVLVLIALWCAIVAIVADNANGLAVDQYGRVANANLYYFSWGGFICSIVLFVNYVKSVYSLDIAGEIRARSARLNLWASLMASSLVVMGSSARIYDNECTIAGTYIRFCNIAKFGVTLGAISTIVSLSIIAIKIATTMAPFACEVISCFILWFAYIFGVSFITAEGAPGSPLGNLYYFTWGSFIFSFLIGSSCFKDYQAAKAANEASRNAQHQRIGAHPPPPPPPPSQDDPVYSYSDRDRDRNV